MILRCEPGSALKGKLVWDEEKGAGLQLGSVLEKMAKREEAKANSRSSTLWTRPIGMWKEDGRLL